MEFWIDSLVVKLESHDWLSGVTLLYLLLAVPDKVLTNEVQEQFVSYISSNSWNLLAEDDKEAI